MGGTIDKCYPRAVGGYAFEFDLVPAAQRIINEIQINPALNVTVERPIEPKDSTEISEMDRQSVAQRIRLLHHQDGVRRFVVTHGTDTLAESALFFHSVALELGNVTVCCVGARLPEVFKGSDAAFNLGFAIAAVQLAGPGAYLTMNGIVIPACEAERDPGSGMWHARTTTGHY